MILPRQYEKEYTCDKSCVKHACDHTPTSMTAENRVGHGAMEIYLENLGFRFGRFERHLHAPAESREIDGSLPGRINLFEQGMPCHG
jgi:hypothetical protein